jgi:hypothetical protein
MSQVQKRGGVWLTLASVALLVAAFVCPSWAFQRASDGALTVYTSRNEDRQALYEVVQHAQRKIARSPLFDPERTYPVFLCANDWRWAFYTLFDTRSAARARAPFPRDVLVRDADVSSNRYRQATGTLAAEDRSLDYLLAHEVTHLMISDAVGATEQHRLPSWLTEGYADYIGRGESFDYDDALRASLGLARTRVPPQTGMYLEHTLLVAHLLEREGLTPKQLFAEPPERQNVAARVFSAR